jgi:hypothetical protein
MKFGSIAIANISKPRRLPGPPPTNCSRSATRAHVAGEGIGLEVAEAACDYIHLYRGDREALTSSLDHIQHAASQKWFAARDPVAFPRRSPIHAVSVEPRNVKSGRGDWIRADA